MRQSHKAGLYGRYPATGRKLLTLGLAGVSPGKSRESV
jgi:hypothetical protein